MCICAQCITSIQSFSWFRHILQAVLLSLAFIAITIILVPLLFLPAWSQILNYSAASHPPPTSLWSITTVELWHWQPGVLSPAKPHSHLIKPLTIFSWMRHWEDWWDKPIGNQVSSYSCWDNGEEPADWSEQLKKHSELCVRLHQYSAPLEGKEKEDRAQRRNTERDKGRKGRSKVG